MRSLILSEEMAGWSFLGAYFAATFVAFAHSIYAWFNRQKSPSLSQFSRMTRCAGWAVGAALIVAYAFNLLSVFAFVALFALVFYGRFRWLAFAKLATWAQDYGDAELAQRYTHRAIALCHDPESAAQLHLAVARYSVANDLGGAALTALDTRRQLLTDYGTPEALAVAHSIGEMEMRISALTLLDRFDEALTECEAILQASLTDPLGGARLTGRPFENRSNRALSGLGRRGESTGGVVSARGQKQPLRGAFARGIGESGDHGGEFAGSPKTVRSRPLEK